MNIITWELVIRIGMTFGVWNTPPIVTTLPSYEICVSERVEVIKQIEFSHEGEEYLVQCRPKQEK